MRNNIWATFCDVKFKSYLIEYLADKYLRRERNINLYMALSTSSSVGAWWIWDKLQIIWSAIIIISQVISVGKRFFPFSKNAEELHSVNSKLIIIANEFEHLWYEYNNGFIDKKAASVEYFKKKSELGKTLDFGHKLVIKANKSDKRKANLKMKNYLKTHYKIDIDIKNKNSKL